MKRKEFLGTMFKYGVSSCLGMHILSNNSIFASNATANIEGDKFLVLFGSIKEALNQDLSLIFKPETVEFTILTEIKKHWGNKDTASFLKELSDKFGSKAPETMKQFVKLSTIPYWTSQGKEAQKGLEIEDYIHKLWDSMDGSFEYKKEIKDGFYRFSVSKCPYAKLAQETNLHEWVYNMACITDYYMVPSYSKEIGFMRTQTMVQGDKTCDHTYYYKKNVKTKDSLLGYCGLYCGGCPTNQKTQNLAPINYKKENNYKCCEGCNSSVLEGWCAVCEIKKCAQAKSVRVCLDCSDFPCSKMTSFINDEKYPYHKKVEASMKQYKEVELDSWILAREKDYKCKNCGAQTNFFQKSCNNCGSALN
jgi:hypothetical protein